MSSRRYRRYSQRRSGRSTGSAGKATDYGSIEEDGRGILQVGLLLLRDAAHTYLLIIYFGQNMHHSWMSFEQRYHRSLYRQGLLST